ncbi:holo-ACP synthase [Pandoraea nosoerga]|uniref:Holo-[acyl-carrier-protein] synthase n=1 Tax=Pandoraea nosoerga TaxID=2508296 RepID=A0A5E4SVE3_9BURK|nr:holo-ACP synthase [Pandoraea nosoerga]MBN4665655.1 holo-ACP synthase [Pandoraea nosoerga]MBN4675646.1 holo-ACP synthase [Pandoraea nosoerga]MBN4680971.1 holo-ACP synthase [Pandoraea nosoerga]MBN4744695.1 holo-ACP synthase [Pandoraea nosoerga]VVD79607.1 holo-ACP synthase [Pandoraea nosoerga]
MTDPNPSTSAPADATPSHAAGIPVCAPAHGATAVFGVGTDILQISRVVGVMSRTNGRFAQRILGPEELKVYHARQKRSEVRGLAYLCTRFAAKEAVSKAIGLGMRWPMTWRAVQTLNAPSGKPMVVVSEELAQWLAERQLSIEISITDEKDYAVAFAIASRNIASEKT